VKQHSLTQKGQSPAIQTLNLNEYKKHFKSGCWQDNDMEIIIEEKVIYIYETKGMR
jgi:hypothetical protein